MEKVIIIGSGCAGLTAGIYTARANLKPLIIEGLQAGGLLTTTSDVENFSGFANGINGFELVWNMRTQAEKFGARLLSDVVESLDLSGDIKEVHLQSGKTLKCEKLILALGAKPRLTGALNEDTYYGGKGVSTCATCDGAFYKNQDVAIIGGGDSACEEADFLSKFASKVYLIHRRDTLRASKIMAERALNNPKIIPIWDSAVIEVLGKDDKCHALKIENLKTKELSEIKVKAMFVAIGHSPNTQICKGQLELDDAGYIITQAHSLVKTSIENVYAAGDCCDKEFRQAITAAGMGAMAAILASR
ncbi:MAG: thioredoxin-disulfide reductase [Opitutales bacterium]